MALASFPDGSYLELIAIQPKADPAALAAHYWQQVFGVGRGSLRVGDSTGGFAG